MYPYNCSMCSSKSFILSSSFQAQKLSRSNANDIINEYHKESPNNSRTLDVVVLIDRQQGAKDNLKQVKIRLHSGLSVTELFKHLKHTKRIPAEQYNLLIQYLRKGS